MPIKMPINLTKERELPVVKLINEPDTKEAVQGTLT